MNTYLLGWTTVRVGIAVAAVFVVAIASVEMIERKTNGWMSKEKEKKKKRKETIGRKKGIVKLWFARSIRQKTINAAILQRAIEQCDQTVYVYVTTKEEPCDPSTTMSLHLYISELYQHVWSIACSYDKYLLDIRIVPSFLNSLHSLNSVNSVNALQFQKEDRYQTYEEILQANDMEAVFGENDLMDSSNKETNEKIKKKKGEKQNKENNKNMQKREQLTFVSVQDLVELYTNPSVHFFEELEEQMEERKRTQIPFHIVVLGGTFDHLHNGHKRLLFLAMSICAKKLIIGITADEMLRKKNDANQIQSSEERAHHVREYVKSIRPNLSISTTIIYDAYGPCVHIEEEFALVVSTETLRGGLKINERRKQNELKPCALYICRRDNIETLSSTYLRSLGV